MVAKFWKVDVSDEDNIKRAIDAGFLVVQKNTDVLTVSEWD